MWWLFQTVIVVAVSGTLVSYDMVGHNGLLAMGAGIAAAFGATLAVTRLKELLR